MRVDEVLHLRNMALDGFGIITAERGRRDLVSNFRQPIPQLITRTAGDAYGIPLVLRKHRHVHASDLGDGPGYSLLRVRSGLHRYVHLVHGSLDGSSKA